MLITNMLVDMRNRAHIQFCHLLQPTAKRCSCMCATSPRRSSAAGSNISGAGPVKISYACARLGTRTRRASRASGHRSPTSTPVSTLHGSPTSGCRESRRTRRVSRKGSSKWPNGWRLEMARCNRSRKNIECCNRIMMDDDLETVSLLGAGSFLHWNIQLYNAACFHHFHCHIFWQSVYIFVF